MATSDQDEKREDIFVGTANEVAIERPSNPAHASKITPEQIRDFFAGKVASVEAPGDADSVEQTKALNSSESLR